MSKTCAGKQKKSSANSKLYKKVRKEYLQETISLLSFPANSEVLSHIPSELRQEVMFVFLQLHVSQNIKKNLELQVVLLMGNEVRVDDEMYVEEHELRGEVWL